MIEQLTSCLLLSFDSKAIGFGHLLIANEPDDSESESEFDDFKLSKELEDWIKKHEVYVEKSDDDITIFFDNAEMYKEFNNLFLRV